MTLEEFGTGLGDLLCPVKGIIELLDGGPIWRIWLVKFDHLVYHRPDTVQTQIRAPTDVKLEWLTVLAFSLASDSRTSTET